MQKKAVILFVLYLIVFLNFFGFSLILPVLSHMVSHPGNGLISQEVSHQFGDYIYSIILGAGSLGSLLFAPFIGRVSDLIGRKKTLLGCASLRLISFILPITAFSSGCLWLFILGNALNGISSNSQPVSQAAIRDISPPKNLAYRYCVDISIVCAAMTLGPSIGELFLGPSGAASLVPFYIATGLSFMALVTVWALLPETNQHRLQLKKSSEKIFSLSVGVFIDIAKLPSATLRLLLVLFLAQTAWGQYFQYLFIYMIREFHFSSLKLTLFAFLSGGISVFGLLFLFKKIHPRHSLTQIITLSMGVSTLCLLGMALIHHESAQWILMPIISVFMAIYFPCILTIFSTETPDTHRGWILSLSNGVIGIGWLITGFSAIWLANLNPHLPLLVSGGLLLLGWGVMRSKRAG